MHATIRRYEGVDTSRMDEQHGGTPESDGAPGSRLWWNQRVGSSC